MHLGEPFPVYDGVLERERRPRSPRRPAPPAASCVGARLFPVRRLQRGQSICSSGFLFAIFFSASLEDHCFLASAARKFTEMCWVWRFCLRYFFCYPADVVSPADDYIEMVYLGLDAADYGDLEFTTSESSIDEHEPPAKNGRCSDLGLYSDDE
ncbi:hypothetical protein EVAR_62733_1 [Eumeta japonica]|uniref:Uncharacterized protein n=1 Tax=Eumeta variegata TaxID=151549 RepID=A0A4C2A1F8_EUMVA|nr:hypothetical protein EVAR_62733_1 [Eumeta japonica]